MKTNKQVISSDIVDDTIQNIIDTIPTILMITNTKEIKRCNKAFLDFFNITSLEEFTNKYDCICDLFINGDNLFYFEKKSEDISWIELLKKEDEDKRLVSILNKDLIAKTFKVSFTELKNKEKEFLISLTDITDIIKEKNMFEYFAFHDQLTKIYNRQKFYEMLKYERANVKRHNDSLSLIMFDIDYFKKVNDTYGHEIGDVVLINLAQLITDNLRETDIFARWGGEEFMILLPRTNIDGAYKTAKTLKDIVQNYNDSETPKITISLGVAEISQIQDDDEALQMVDKALYKAKIKRNDVVCYSISKDLLKEKG